MRVNGLPIAANRERAVAIVNFILTVIFFWLLDGVEGSDDEDENGEECREVIGTLYTNFFKPLTTSISRLYTASGYSFMMV